MVSSGALLHWLTIISEVPEVRMPPLMVIGLTTLTVSRMPPEVMRVIGAGARAGSKGQGIAGAAVVEAGGLAVVVEQGEGDVLIVTVVLLPGAPGITGIGARAERRYAAAEIGDGVAAAVGQEDRGAS